MAAVSSDAMPFAVCSTKICPASSGRLRLLLHHRLGLLLLSSIKFHSDQTSKGGKHAHITEMKIENTRRILAVSLGDQEATLSRVVQGRLTSFTITLYSPKPHIVKLRYLDIKRLRGVPANNT